MRSLQRRLNSIVLRPWAAYKEKWERLASALVLRVHSMTMADLTHAVNEVVQSCVWTRAPGAGAPANSRSSESGDRSDWQCVTDVLNEWRGKQGLRDEDDIRWPDASVIELGYGLATSLQNRGFRAPTRCVPNGEGGIVFEYQHERELQTIEIEAEGTIDICRFCDTKLTDTSQVLGPFYAA
jgi:hypothetical protein